jgi:cell division protein FtsL
MRLKASVIIKILLVCFVGYSAFTLVSVNKAIAAKKAESQQLQQQIEQQKVTNEELSELVENGVSDEYLERIAREKLGLAYSNERIFVNPDSSTQK